MNFKKYMEMTMSAGQLFFTMPDFSKATHIGDTENHKILHYEHQGTNVYGIAVDDKPMGYLQTTFNIMPLMDQLALQGSAMVYFIPMPQV